MFDRAPDNLGVGGLAEPAAAQLGIIPGMALRNTQS